MKIGVLALQGAFAEHAAALRKIPGTEPVEVRRRADFYPGLAGLIIPGGESTVMSKLLVDLDLLPPIAAAVRSGLPVFGTCAGLILLAREVEGPPLPRLGPLAAAVRRNAYGRQLDSFAARADFAGMPDVPMVFIRAPGVIRLGPEAEALARVDGRIVAARQGNILATTFHPELTPDVRVHAYFLEMAAARRPDREGRARTA